MGIPQENEDDNRLILLYEGLKGKASIPTDDLIPKTRRCRNQHSMAFQTPIANADVYKGSFFPHTIRDCLPVHSFNALIIPILRGCLQSLFNIPVPWYLFDTVLKVTSWPAFVSRCIIDAYFSFYGLVLDIDMNCGCRLYRSFWQMDLTYAMDCLLNSITGMNVAFLSTVSPPYTQLWLSQTD